MLSRLYVKNIALIEEADIAFNEKFNVLSGETGSGKSILLDSVNFVLGSKADKSLIRFGESEAFVKAEFSVESDSAACKILEDMDIDCDGEIIISRKYSIDGKGSIKINGNTVTGAMLKRLTASLVDVHGQSEHFFLLDEANQLKTVDNLCGERVISLKNELAELVARKKELKKQVEKLGGDEQERERALDLLSYQINEIEKADIKVGECEQLRAKKKLIDNSEKIISALGMIKGVLSDDNGCTDMLSVARRQASTIADFDEKYGEIYTRIENLSVEAGDLSDEISDLLDETSFDEREAQTVEERLELLRGLFKKYGADEEEVLSFLSEAKTKYEELINAAENIEKISREIESCDNSIYSLCKKITEERKNRCEKLSADIVKELKSLNIPNAQFCVEFNTYDKNSANLNSANGSDEIKFMFSANKGEPMKPLSKVISGGEMSRFMLAIKTQLKDINGISTYIFDEIDEGISGMTAKTVAEKFIDISENTQIIAVSHLPQVCAAATAQFLIYKTDIDQKTVSNVKLLNREQRVEEIMRLAGNTNSQAAKTHAEELLASFGN